MRNSLSIALIWLLSIHLVPGAYGAESFARVIAAMPAGSRIEVRLKNNQTMRGARGPVTDSGFTLIDARAGEHMIVFGDVAAVKPFTRKSHTTRNVLIGVGVGVAALGITAALILRCAPFGCGRHTF